MKHGDGLSWTQRDRHQDFVTQERVQMVIQRYEEVWGDGSRIPLVPCREIPDRK